MTQLYDFIVVGAGIFGCWSAIAIAEKGYTVALIEKNTAIMMQASWHNQARIHNGYHYPRSFSTAAHSHKNYKKFMNDFTTAVYDDFKHIYAIPKHFSHINAMQFEKICHLLNIPLSPLSQDDFTKLFDINLIEKSFWADEKVFDVIKLREIINKKIKHKNITVFLNTTCKKINTANGKILCETDKFNLTATRGLLNVTYSGINHLLAASGLTPLPIKFELTEICLVKVPPLFSHLGVTIMDGPFFSCIPFPSEKCHSLTHVSYTPHFSANNINPLLAAEKSDSSRFTSMKLAAQKFMPVLEKMEYISSFYEIKAIPLFHEQDDARPILFVTEQNHPIIVSILGAKIDCYYDLIDEINAMLRRL